MEKKLPKITPPKSWSPRPSEKPSPNGIIDVPVSAWNILSWLVPLTKTIQDPEQPRRFAGVEKDGIKGIKDLERGKRGDYNVVIGDPRMQQLGLLIKDHLKHGDASFPVAEVEHSVDELGVAPNKWSD